MNETESRIAAGRNNLKRLVTSIEWISLWAGKLSAYLTLPVIFVVSYEIVARYVFHRPTIWAVETMIYGCAVIYVMAAAWALLDGRHVKIDMVYEKFSPRRRAVLDCITFVFFALYIGMMVWATTKYAWRSVAILEMSDSPWRPPLWPMKVFLAVGVFLILLQGVAKFIRDLHFALTGKDL
jgi:TRAP-type mannitol/chloroaromatic compound transport system permease small subunit